MTEKRQHKKLVMKTDTNPHFLALYEHFKNDQVAIALLKNLEESLNGVSAKITKKSRNNSNTGLGIARKLTEASVKFLEHVGMFESDTSNRSYMTSAISQYVKKNQLQLSDKKLFFSLDEHLSKLFSLNNVIALSRTQLDKYLQIECVTHHTQYTNQYINEQHLQNNNTVNLDSHLIEILSLQPGNLVSWRELQKILFISFN